MIRLAEAADLPAVRRLWEICFPDEGGFNDYFFDRLFHIEHTLLSVENGQLCAMTQMLPYPLTVYGKTGQATYIYGACTDPAHRRQGHMARLLQRSFALDRAAGRTASILIPAEPWLFGFYAAFGYENAFYVQKNEIVRTETAAELPRPLTEDDIPALHALYERELSAFDGFVPRSAAEWRRQLALFGTVGAGAFGWMAGDRLAAYAFCWTDTAQETVGLTDARAQGLLRTLSRDTLHTVAPGAAEPLGVALFYDQPAEKRCYMNLMLN